MAPVLVIDLPRGRAVSSVGTLSGILQQRGSDLIPPPAHHARMLRRIVLLLCLLLPCSGQTFLQEAERIMDSTPVIDG